MVSKEYLGLNRLLAGITFVLSFIVYIATMADTVSYWDCGEFIATSYILGVPHPPGSPLYLILGRVFSMLPFSSDIAFRVNLISPLISAVAVMLLYLIIVKVVAHWRGAVNNPREAGITLGAALVGALTFAFTDSHWFNAVEAEVYAMSTFFTAVVVWLILHWSERADRPGNERYILIIAYMIGLALGVHMLNLLALPYIALIIYFRKQPFEWKSFGITVAFTGITFLIIHNGIIKGLPRLAGSISLYGVVVVLLAVAGFTIWSITSRHQLVSLALTSVVLILVGYSSYTLIFIRSNQNPGIDENDPETVPAAIAYLEREQYGAISSLPRRYDGLPAQHTVVGMPANGRDFSSAQNRKYRFYNLDKQWDFFWNYQVKKMYWRYFLWQFAGRGPSPDKWVIPFGADASEDGVNWFQFGLPLALLLGLGGMLHHFKRDWKGAFSILTLFFMTGLAVIIYLNQDNPQPRERDYSYVGSFMAFAVWIGVGAAAIGERLTEFIKDQALGRKMTLAATAVLLILIPGIMLQASYNQHDRSGNYVAWDYSYNLLQSCEPDGIIFTNGDNDTFPLWYLQEVEGLRRDVTVANLSLLNTPWYIKQLRDKRPEGERFINLSDLQIERLSVQSWKKREVTLPVQGEAQITWTIKPTYMGAAIKVQDLMIMQIINDNAWRYPVYFAVTVSPSNRIGLDKYLEMEGLVFRVTPGKQEAINRERMQANLMTENETFSRDYQPGYLFRNLDNPEVYYNPNVIKLLQNYRSAFMQLAVSYYFDYQALTTRAGADSAAVETARQQVLAVLERMGRKLPQHTIPMTSDDLYYQLGRLYGALGEPDRLRSILEDLVSQPQVSTRQRIEYGMAFLRELGDYERGRMIFEDLYHANSQNPEVVSALFQAYRQLNLRSEAERILNDWIARNPGDKVAQQMLEELARDNLP